MSATTHEITIRVYYEDTDFSGIVYHANHLKFFERGRTDALRAIGISHTELLDSEEPLVFTVRRMVTEWVAPARIDDMLTVKTEFIMAKGARMALRQEMWRGDTLIAKADVEAACINMEGRPRRLPKDVIGKLLNPAT